MAMDANCDLIYQHKRQIGYPFDPKLLSITHSILEYRHIRFPVPTWGLLSTIVITPPPAELFGLQVRVQKLCPCCLSDAVQNQ